MSHKHKKCEKCGGEVYIYLKGEPVYLCSKCGKYYGTVPVVESVDILLHEFSVGNMLPQVPVSKPIVTKENPPTLLPDDKPIDYLDEIELENEYRLESASMKRSKLPDDVFGIPELRKYPMPDKKHVISAIKLFNHVTPKYEEELAKNIIKNIKKYKIDTSFIGEKNRLQKYI